MSGTAASSVWHDRDVRIRRFQLQLRLLPLVVLGALLALVSCTRKSSPRAESATPSEGGGKIRPRPHGARAASRPSPPASAGSRPPRPSRPVTASLPLLPVADVPLPGRPVRFDYQAVDLAKGHLIIAHMNDASVDVVQLGDGSLVKVVPGIPTARGVVVADDVGRIFVTSSPDKLVIIDNTSLSVIGRVSTGSAPDGDGWDPKDKIVGVSDQGDGAVSLISDAGSGRRKQVRLGSETGNVVYDAARGVFWVTVVHRSPPDRLVSIDPVSAKPVLSIPLPGCAGAHGLRIHPDGKSALIACENNSKVVRVNLVGTAHALTIAACGADPDVLAIDPGLGWLYVAAESGDLTVFDIGRPGLTTLDREHPGNASHSVAVDPKTHHVFFPLIKGRAGKPVLRIMKPKGT